VSRVTTLPENLEKSGNSKLVRGNWNQPSLFSGL